MGLRVDDREGRPRAPGGHRKVLRVDQKLNEIDINRLDLTRLV